MRLQLALDLGHRQGAEGEALQTRDDGRADLAGVGGAEDEEHALGRLLERLEQDVPALLDALDLIDDEDLASQVSGTGVDARHQLAHVVDLVVGGCVELDHVERAALADGHAAGTGVTGFAVAQVGAVDGLGHDARHRGLARASRTDEEEAVADATEPNRVAQRLHHCVLTDDLGERLRAEAPIQRLAGGAARLEGRGRDVCHRSPCAAAVSAGPWCAAHAQADTPMS